MSDNQATAYLKSPEATELTLKNHLSFSAGAGGLPKATLLSAKGLKAEVYLFGATITSLKSPDFGELLYLSPKADFSGTKPLRGGIPLVFPQFSGLGPLPAHGFARTSIWTPKQSCLLENGEVQLTLSLSSAGSSAALWPYQFEAELEITLGSALKTTMRITNRGNPEFSFHNAFHTYFAVGDITAVQITPLGGLTYLDNTNKRAPNPEKRDIVSFSGETDRVYVRTPSSVVIRDEKLRRSITIEKSNLPDCVVWNPGAERCQAIKDLPPDAFKSFVCAEPANAVDAITLAGGQQWECAQLLSARKD